MRKVLVWVALAFAGFYVVTDPTGAASGAHHALSGLGHLAHALAAFMTALSHS